MDSFEANRRDPDPGGGATPAVRARQGVISGRVLTVLVTSLSLSAVALLIAWLAFG